jgi:hypothetical protein
MFAICHDFVQGVKRIFPLWPTGVSLAANRLWTGSFALRLLHFPGKAEM